MRLTHAARRVLAFLVLGTLALAGTAAAYLLKGRREVTTTSEEAYHLYLEGRQNQLKLYQKEAFASYAAALEKDPQFLMATLRLATLMSGRDPERAKSLVAAAASRCVEGITPRERLYLRLIQAEFAKSPDVEKIVEEYTRRFPNDPEGYQWKADRLTRAGKMAEAVAELERLLSYDPNHAFAYNTLGYYTASRGEWAKAEEYFFRYRYLAPDQANPHDSLGELYANTGRYDEAERSLREAIRIKPDFFASYGHMGTLEMARGNFAAAADWYRRAAEMTDPPVSKFYDFRVAAAGALVFAGRLDESLAELERGVAELKVAGVVKPAVRVDLDGVRLKAVFLARGGRPDEAAAALAEARQLLEQHRAEFTEKDAATQMEKRLAVSEGTVALAQGDAEKAARLIGAYFAEDGKTAKDFVYFPGDSLLRVTWATSLKASGHEEEAREALRPILARNPRFAPAGALAVELGLTEARPL